MHDNYLLNRHPPQFFTILHPAWGSTSLNSQLMNAVRETVINSREFIDGA